jgi:hypothetical protein
MYHEQSVTNLIAKGASAAELNKWRDAQVDPELLRRPAGVEPRNYDTAQRPIGFQVAEIAFRGAHTAEAAPPRYEGSTISRTGRSKLARLAMNVDVFPDLR